MKYLSEHMQMPSHCANVDFFWFVFNSQAVYDICSQAVSTLMLVLLRVDCVVLGM